MTGVPWNGRGVFRGPHSHFVITNLVPVPRPQDLFQGMLTAICILLAGLSPVEGMTDVPERERGVECQTGQVWVGGVAAGCIRRLRRRLRSLRVSGAER